MWTKIKYLSGYQHTRDYYLLSARPKRIQILSKIKIVEFPSQTHFTIIFSNFNSKCDGVFVNDVIKIGWRGGGGGSGNNFCNTMYKGVSKTTILLRQWGRGPGVGWWHLGDIYIDKHSILFTWRLHVKFEETLYLYSQPDLQPTSYMFVVETNVHTNPLLTRSTLF